MTRLVLVNGAVFPGGMHAERFMRPARAPHYTIGRDRLVAELALSATGTLILDAFFEFSYVDLADLFKVRALMIERARPLLILGLRLDSFRAPELASHQLRKLEILPRVDAHFDNMGELFASDVINQAAIESVVAGVRLPGSPRPSYELRPRAEEREWGTTP